MKNDSSKIKTKNVKENSNPTALLPHQFERTKKKKEKKRTKKIKETPPIFTHERKPKAGAANQSGTKTPSFIIFHNRY